MQTDELYAKIVELSKSLGFSDLGCAKAERLSAEEGRYRARMESGFFGEMGYLKRNVEKRFDPRLLLPGCQSVIVFLAPFAKAAGGECNGSGRADGGGDDDKRSGWNGDGGRISEYAQGLDYHTVIKKKLRVIAEAITTSFAAEVSAEGVSESRSVSEGLAKGLEQGVEPVRCRIFVDSAPILERAWAVKAGLGFIGKNNFLVSPTHGVKNFIGILLTTAQLPYNQTVIEPQCGECERCLKACSQKAWVKPYVLDARKCLSYKTIEQPLKATSEPAKLITPKMATNVSSNTSENVDPDTNTSALKVTEQADTEAISNPHRWIFGCDDCMNACPYNAKNDLGWDEFRTKPCDEFGYALPNDFFQRLEPQDFERLFGCTPLTRAGLEKLRQNERNAQP